jgi:hypothetical protein
MQSYTDLVLCGHQRLRSVAAYCSVWKRRQYRLSGRWCDDPSVGIQPAFGAAVWRWKNAVKLIWLGRNST